jgi:hypothetical protein
MVTDEGRRFFCDFGIDIETGVRSKRAFCRTCLDWSERRPHLGGRLGADILDRSLELAWVARIPESRALRITQAGRRDFTAVFGLPSDWSSSAA